MSLTSTYAKYQLALTVKLKLTRAAARPDALLRVLVTQANMLDLLLDLLSADAKAAASAAPALKVTFVEPVRSPLRDTTVTSVEIESDSEDEYDDDSDYDDEDSDLEFEYDEPAYVTSYPSLVRLLSIAEEDEEEPHLTFLSSDDDEEMVQTPAANVVIASPKHNRSEHRIDFHMAPIAV